MRSLTGICAMAVCAVLPAVAHAEATSDSAGDQKLSSLSIEDLANIEVRSVSKRNEPLSVAPAALYVIDHDRIVRSGAVSIPEILRLASNLQVYQSSPSNWIVTARGQNGLPAAQSYSNKLLVLVDGRTIYTALYSGVYWDMPDLLPNDIERIEVISGPGATMWGANAVNGVINIVTRRAGASPGAYATVKAGTVQQVAGLRYSGQAGSDVSYRVYGRWQRQDAAEIAGGGSASDDWHRLGGGFRLDWAPDETDTLTVQGDIFRGREDQPGPARQIISGHNAVLRWTRAMSADEQVQVQAFYDRIRRSAGASSGSFYADTYDLDLQHNFDLGSRHHLVWGGGARLVHYKIDGTPNFFFVPNSRNLFLGNIFVQDTVELAEKVSITAGLKAEHDPYVGFSLLPSARLAFEANDSTMIWAAVSRAVRSPTPFDVDVREQVPGVTLSGNRDFRTEKLTAYELGLRAQPLFGVSFSVTGFYHQYDDLRSVELGTGPGLDLFWANGLKGHSYGLEAWATARPLPWWTLSAGATLLREDFDFKDGASGLIGTFQNGIDPKHQFKLRSSMDLGEAVSLDLDLRSIGKLDGGGVPAYAELGGRLAWSVSDQFTLSLTGANLLHDAHVEYPGGDAISRKLLVGVEWRP